MMSISVPSSITKKIFIIAFLLSLPLSLLHSQTKGKFDTSIKFNNESRTISFYVPADYDSTKQYNLMVCLHGLGDNSVNFRNALISSLGWQNFIKNTIFACPDGGSDQGKDFYSPQGDEAIIQATIDTVTARYNINPSTIILEGFSLGGRSALKFALDHPGKFHGLLLNTPAMQGALDAMNNPLISLGFNYQNACKQPIAITHGSEDVIYLSPVQIMQNYLVENNGPTVRYLVDGMGHNIPGKDIIKSCMDFINNPAPNKCDVEVSRVDIAVRTFESSVQPKIVIRNLGSESIKKAEIEYSVNGIKSSFTFTPDSGIMSFERAIIKLPEITLLEGDNTISAAIKLINGGIEDTITANNESSAVIKMIRKGASLPFTEGFEGEDFPPKDWELHESGNTFSWSPDNETAKDGKQSLSMFNTALLFYCMGMQEDLSTPVLDLTTVKDPALSFHLAFNYNRYTPPYTAKTVDFTDTLEISVSRDNGLTFERVFRKAGAELASAKEPIVNALDILSCIFVPKEDEWTYNVIDLSKFSDAGKAIVRFSLISGMGGTIYIDNIRFDNKDALMDVREELQADGQAYIYPNPARSATTLYFENEQPCNARISLFDASGRVVSKVFEGETTSGLNKATINTDGLTSGLYFVRIYKGETLTVKKLVVE